MTQSACRKAALALMFLSVAGLPAGAAERFFLYNLTTATIFTGVYLAPAGSRNWGPNQALNDKDKEVDPSERLILKDISHGQYDAKLVDAKGRTCLRPGVDLTKENTFDVRDGDLNNCQ